MRILSLSLLLATLPALAEHLPGGNLGVRCVGGNQYEVTLKLWRECTGSAMIDQGISFVNECGVSFSLNSMPLISTANVSPICEGQTGQTTCDGGTLVGIEEYTYQVIVFLSPCDFWRIYWSTCCRYPALNLEGSQGIYIEALVNNSGPACVELPTFVEDTPPLVCVNQHVSYDPGVLFDQGQELRFRLIDARRLLNADPFNLDIQPVTYQSPFNGAEPYTGLAIDSLTGQITFTPLAQGYIVCVIAVDVRDANGVLRGTITRDFPFIAQVCDNAVPDADSGVLENAIGLASITGPYSLEACGNSCVDAVIVDPDGAQTLSITSNIESAIPGASFNVNGANPAVVTICFGGGATQGTYLFTLTAQDDACPVRGTQIFTYTVAYGDDPDAGSGATIAICPGESVDLDALMNGQEGGSWSEGPVVIAEGTYTYTVTTSCGEEVAVFEVVAGPAPDAGADSTGHICEGGTINLQNLLTGEPGGTWSEGPEVSQPGAYTYSLSSGCGSDEAVFTVSILQPAYAGDGDEILVCPQTLAFTMLDSMPGDPVPGGAWLYGVDAVDGVFDPAIDPDGDYCYTIANACGSDTACLRINFLDPLDPYCIFLGVLEVMEESLLHPNPTSGSLNLGNRLPAVAEVIDASGRVVWRQPAPSYATMLLPAGLSDGCYALRLHRPDGTVTVHRFELMR